MDTDRTGAPLVRISVGMWNDLLHRIADLEAARLDADTRMKAADPKPPTLREQVHRVITEAWRGTLVTPSETADAVLAVVADWLAAQPLATRELSDFRREQRDHDVRLLRGEPDAPRCPAHGMTLGEHQRKGDDDCTYRSDRCQCGVYATTGMHWDTCPGRGRHARGAS